MRSTHHPHLTDLVHTAVVALAAGVLVTACGANDAGGPTLSAAGEAGREITRTRGCAACHGRNGGGSPGPAFVGLYGSTVEFKDGTAATADDDYLFESIREPGARLVAGYGFPMPENDLTDDEIRSVIDYIRELAGEETP